MRGYNHVQAVICSNILDRILCLFHYRQTPKEPVNSPHKRPVTLKMSPFDDAIMTIEGVSE